MLRLAALTRRRVPLPGRYPASRPHSFFPCSRRVPDEATPGLFGLPGLHAPSDWSRIASACIHDCLRYADQIRLHQLTRDARLLQTFDDLSDRLCSVLDVAELCRNVHPSPHFVHAAHDAFTDISTVLQQLNADHTLYRPLSELHQSNADATAAAGGGGGGGGGDCGGGGGGFLSPEDSVMLKSLKTDFERGGINLDPRDKSRLLAYQQSIDRTSARFLSTPHTSTVLEIADEKLRNVPLGMRQRFGKSSRRGYVRVPIDGPTAQMLLKWVPDSRVREKVYRALHGGGKSEKVHALDALLGDRHELAQILGQPSYAELLFSDRVAASPAGVARFLEQLSREVQEAARKERKAIEIEKMRMEPHLVNDGRVGVHGWDRSFYIGRLKAQNFDLSSAQVANYMPLSGCLSVLADIVGNVFGVKMIEVQPLEGEVWHEDVRKAKLIDDSGSVLGYIFFDLYPRMGKFGHAAHFSIKCGRQMGAGAEYQVPSVALVCNFGKVSSSGSRLLTISEYETLFHEFGHSLHSLLSRTKYQHLSGTRVATDLVEVPSHLFEHFAWDPRIIARFARHHVTQEPMPTGLLRSLCASRKGFVATDVQMQLLFSAMDLEFHGLRPPLNATTDAFERLQSELTAYPPDKGVAVPSSFHHFVGYGAGYYSYIFARIISAQIWSAFFQKDPLSRAGGDKLRYGLLSLGGACDSSTLVHNLLDQDISCGPFLQSIGMDARSINPNLRLPLASPRSQN